MNIKLIILDIDGVLTNSCKTYNLEGEVISKDFNDKDFTAIKRFKENGISVCFLTGDDRVNRKIAESRKIPFYYIKDYPQKDDKVEMLTHIKTIYDVNDENIVYVGDDLPDFNIIKKIKNSYCPSDAINKIKKAAKTVLTRRGGTGVIAELYDNIYNE